MEKFKKTIQKRIWMLTIVVGIFSILLALQVSDKFVSIIPNQNYVDFLRGFRFGLLVAVVGIGGYSIFYYLTALNNADKLKKIYIKENDERTCEIDKRSGMASFKVMLIILILAAIIVGYFSLAGFIALLGAVLLELIVRLILYCYYSKTL